VVDALWLPDQIWSDDEWNHGTVEAAGDPEGAGVLPVLDGSRTAHRLLVQ
jgi:hypothetical protein